MLTASAGRRFFYLYKVYLFAYKKEYRRVFHPESGGTAAAFMLSAGFRWKRETGKENLGTH